MTNKKKDPLKSLIRTVELDKPSLDFTGSVMEEVQAQKEAATNPALKSLLKRNGVENPSMAFTQGVLAQVEALGSHTKYKSIIPKKAWVFIISGIVLLVLFVNFSEKSQMSPGGLTKYFIDIGNALSTRLTRVNSIPPLYPITVIALSGILLSDYLLRIRNQTQERQNSKASLH